MKVDFFLSTRYLVNLVKVPLVPSGIVFAAAGVCCNLCTCFNCQIGRYGTPNSLELEDEDEIDSSITRAISVHCTFI